MRDMRAGQGGLPAGVRRSLSSIMPAGIQREDEELPKMQSSGVFGQTALLDR